MSKNAEDIPFLETILKFSPSPDSFITQAAVCPCVTKQKQHVLLWMEGLGQLITILAARGQSDIPSVDEQLINKKCTGMDVPIFNFP